MATATRSDLDNGLGYIRDAPAHTGALELIVARPGEDHRRVLDHGELDVDAGLVGDNWRDRGSAELARQITVMNARCIALLDPDRERWPLAGDQLYVDFDLSVDNLPAGTGLRVGSAVIEISEEPHTGCGKFSRRFGLDALRFVNSPEGRRLRLRGLNARVIEGGTIEIGDAVVRI